MVGQRMQLNLNHWDVVWRQQIHVISQKSINCFIILCAILANITTGLFTFLSMYPPVKTNMGCKNPPSRQGNMRQLRVQFGALSVGKNYPSNGSKCRKNKKQLGGSTTFLWFVDLKIWTFLSLIWRFFCMFLCFLTGDLVTNNINVKAFGVG